MAQNYYIPRRPEVRPPHFRFQNTQPPAVAGFRGTPQLQHSSVIYSSPLSPPLTSGLAKSPVLERYPPAATAHYPQNGQEPVRRQGMGLPPPPSTSAYYRADPSGRNFLTLPINRSQSRTPLPLSGSPGSTSPRPASKAPPEYYRTYSHSPFGTGRRPPPVLDKYPSLLTLNDVKITPLPGQRPGRYSTSVIPSVLDRYPPAAADGGYYAKASNRNSAPVQSSMPSGTGVPPSPGFRKKQSSVDDNFVPNRFRYPASPGRTPPPGSPRTEFPPNFDYSTPLSSRMGQSPVRTPSPPPPPPLIKPVNTHGKAPPPPKRNPANTSTLVRKPSVKVKRSSSTASTNQTHGRSQGQQSQQQMSTRRRLPPQNHPSRLLNEDENEYVFQILGNGRQTLATAIVQLLLPSRDDNYGEEWKLREVTVLCFVRDPSQKSYFLEFLSLRMRRCIYSCEIYEEFDYRTIKNTRFITFEGEESRVGVNFADDEEFYAFKDTLDKKIEARKQRRYDRQSKAFELATSDHLPNGHKEDRHQTPQTLAVPKKSKFTLRRFSNAKSKKDKKSKKLDKRNIGTPTQFRHISHAGFDSQNGFQSYGDIDVQKYQEVFQKAKISERQLNDPETRKFIYEFVEKYEKEATPQTPPPQRMTPPPPPVNQRISPAITPSPPPPPRMILPKNNSDLPPPDEPEPDYPSQYSRSPPPPPSRIEHFNRPPPPPAPPLPTNNTGAYPPPPPPMPMAMEQSTRSPNQIQRPVQVPSSSPEGDARSNLMKAIQEAAKGKLKPVGQASAQGNNSPKSSAMDGMAGALQRALAERSRAINPDSSESESDEEAFDSEDWDDD